MAICPKDLALFQPSTQSLTLPSWAGCPPTFQGVFSRVGKEDCWARASQSSGCTPITGEPGPLRGGPVLGPGTHISIQLRAACGRRASESQASPGGALGCTSPLQGSRSPPRCAPLPGGRGTCRVLPPLPVRPSTRCAAPRMGAASPFLSVGHLTRSLSPRRAPVARPPSGRSWDGAVGTRPCLQPDSPRPPSSHPCPRRREGRGVRGPAGFLAGFGGGPLGRLGHKAAL